MCECSSHAAIAIRIVIKIVLSSDPERAAHRDLSRHTGRHSNATKKKGDEPGLASRLTRNIRLHRGRSSYSRLLRLQIHGPSKAPVV